MREDETAGSVNGSRFWYGRLILNDDILFAELHPKIRPGFHVFNQGSLSSLPIFPIQPAVRFCRTIRSAHGKQADSAFQVRPPLAKAMEALTAFPGLAPDVVGGAVGLCHPNIY